MWRNKIVFLFPLKFLIIYFVLVLPVFPFADGCVRMMREHAAGIFHRFEKTGEARFSKMAGKKYDTNIIVCNKAAVDQNGKIHGIQRDFSFQLSWFIPLALISGLIFASPVNAGRKVLAWFISTLVLYLILLLRLKLFLSDTIFRYPELNFPGDGARQLLSNIYNSFFDNPNPTYMFCILLWLTITFRKTDWDKLFLFLGNRTAN